MRHVITSTPRTVMEVFKMLPEGTLAEVIENNLHISPAPNPYHQRVIVSLITALNMQVKQDGLHGVPDIIIEVTSPGNKKHETVIKKNLYEKSGVKEHCIVDPETKQSTGYFLKENTYSLIAEDSGTIASALLEETFLF